MGKDSYKFTIKIPVDSFDMELCKKLMQVGCKLEGQDWFGDHTTFDKDNCPDHLNGPSNTFGYTFTCISEDHSVSIKLLHIMNMTTEDLRFERTKI